MISSPLKNISIKLPPINLEGYLLSKGWIPEGEILGQATIWHRSDKKHFNFEVIQPKSMEIKGYCQRIIDAINELAVFEDRAPHNILKEIENFFLIALKYVLFILMLKRVQYLSMMVFY